MTPGKRSTPRRNDEAKPNTRQQLIDAVLELLMEDGADAVTVGAVAQRADVALRTVYNHFPSREALLEAALDLITSDIRTVLTEALPEDDPSEVRIRRFVSIAFDQFDRLGPLLTRILSIRGIPQLEARLAEVGRWRREQVDDIVSAACADGTARLEPEHATALIDALIRHGSWEALVQWGGLSAERAGELLGDALVTALIKPA